MYDTPHDITSLISTRICHDLASPIGAIANGMELLELSGLANMPETALIADSVQSAANRLEFMRIAYGTATAGATVAAEKAQKILSGYFGEKKIAVFFDRDSDLDHPLAKLLFLLIQTAESALPYGGEVHIVAADTACEIICTGKEIRIDPDLWTHITGKGQSISMQPSKVQFALALLQAVQMGKAITHRSNDTTLNIMVA